MVEVYDKHKGFRKSPTLRDTWAILSYVVQEVSDFLPILIHSVLGEDWGGGDRELGHFEGESEKSVMAAVNLPHLTGGIYNLKRFLVLDSVWSSASFIEDPVKVPSKVIGNLLAKVFSAKVEPEGVVFMPYFNARFVRPDGKFRREVLFSPKFLIDEVLSDEPKKLSAGKDGKPVKAAPKKEGLKDVGLFKDVPYGMPT